MNPLIVGSGGLIGSNLFSHFKKNGYRVSATTHKINAAEATLHLDLSDPDAKIPTKFTPSITHAILCSAETNIDSCKKNENRSRLLNVSNMIRLIDSLASNGIIPIFLSTDAVFDGVRGDFTEDDVCNPVTLYGKQKLEVERHLNKSHPKSLVIRMSKIFDTAPGDQTLITSWVDSLREQKQIRCAYDHFFTPTLVKDVCRAIDLLAQKRIFGTIHVSGPETFNRFQLASLVADKLQLNRSLIQKVSLSEFDFLEPRVQQNTLNSEKIKKDHGFQFTPIAETIQEIAKNYGLRPT